MSVTEALLTPQIVEARVDHDDAVSSVAKQCGLRVDARAHRVLTGAHLLVCLADEEKVVGFVSARALFGEAEIFDLCVLRDKRRRGIGRALLRRLLDLLREEGVQEVFLEVRASNEGAQALYRSLGFSSSGSRRRYYADGEDAALFRCCLVPTP